MAELREVCDESSEPQISKYEIKKTRNVTKPLGRPKFLTEEAVKAIRLRIAINYYYDNQEEVKQQKITYYQENKERILEKKVKISAK